MERDCQQSLGEQILTGGVDKKRESKVTEAWVFCRRSVPLAAAGSWGEESFGERNVCSLRKSLGAISGTPDKRICGALGNDARFIVGEGVAFSSEHLL